MHTAITVVALFLNAGSAIMQAHASKPWIAIISAFVAGGLAALLVDEALLWRLRRRIRGEWR